VTKVQMLDGIEMTHSL